jgi:MFS family permease
MNVAPNAAANANAQDEKLRHFWHNVAANIGVEGLWGLAFSFMGFTTILPVFLRGLGGTEEQVGLLAAVATFGFAVLQLPTAYWATPLYPKKWPFVWAHVPGVLCWLVIGLLVLSPVTVASPGLVKWLFLGLYAVYALSIGIVIPMWADFMNRVLPASRRGRVWGLLMGVSAGTGLVGALVVRYLLRAYGFPRGYGLCFLLAFVATALGTVCIATVREPQTARPPARPRPGEFVAALRRAALEHRDFRAFLAARCVLGLGAMAGAFYVVHAKEALHLPDSVVGVFIGVGLVFSSALSPLWGWLGDRRGYRITLVACGVPRVAATLIALLWPTYEGFLLVFALLGISMSGDFTASANLTIELCPDEDKTTYNSLANTVTAIPTSVAPLVGGALLAATGSYPLLYLITLIAQAAGVLALAMFVREPRLLAVPAGAPASMTPTPSPEVPGVAVHNPLPPTSGDRR